MTLTKDQQLEMYRRILRIRYFEDAVDDLCRAKKVPGFSHNTVGHEAAIVGACMALRDDDYMAGTHRSHGHPIGKGGDLKGLMAEMLGKVGGICKGRGGSMHFADSSVGIIGESAIVGGGIPLAAGAAMSAQIRGTDQVSLGFFGDGAVNQGTFHESLNMASIWKLPVIYFCENNLYAMTTPLTLSHGQPDIAKHADAYGIPGVSVDGQDVEAVYEVTRVAVERARRGDGPTLIEAKTYRFDEHCFGVVFPAEYRSKAEIEEYRSTRDPVPLYKSHLLKTGMGEVAISTVEQEVRDAVAEALDFAQNSPPPEFSDVYKYMYSAPINYPSL